MAALLYVDRALRTKGKMMMLDEIFFYSVDFLAISRRKSMTPTSPIFDPADRSLASALGGTVGGVEYL